jgi:hypothetical protein
MIPTVLTDDLGRRGSFTPDGDFRVTRDPHDLSSFQEMDIPITEAYNFFPPQNGFNFIITNIHAFADKDVSNSINATVFFYEAPAIDSTTVDRVLLRFEMPRDSIMQMDGLRLLVNSGKWVNGKTNDDDIHVNMLGHYARIENGH